MSNVFLTPKQLAVYVFILESQFTNRCSPSIRQISEHFGVNINATAKKINILQRKGFIEKNADGHILFPREVINQQYFTGIIRHMTEDE